MSGFTAGNPSGIGLPQNGVKGHGVACAGIIAATQDNNIGIKGIAPNVQIVPINIFPNVVDPTFNRSGVATNQQIAQAIDWAWNQGQADVLSCSWGGGAQSNDIDAAIGRARTMGRIINGIAKGCPVVFSSGNSRPFQSVSYPANLDGVITVGACNNSAPSGDIWDYSGRGASMDLVAPSGDINLNGDVTTTDRMGTNGYESGNYTTRFGGTSAACPQVSGVTALMLSVNPNLTEPQVRSILQTTATDMGAAGFDNTFGFGRVNACAALNQSLSLLPISGPDKFCTSDTYSVPSLPAGATVTWSASPAYVVSISTNNNVATLTKVFNSSFQLTATFTTACGNVVMNKTIDNSGPTIGNVVLNDWGGGELYAYVTAGYGPSNITSYSWSFSPSNGVYLSTYNAECNAYGLSPYTNYTITVTGYDACGNSVSTNVNYYSGNTYGRASYNYYPNPASNELTISYNETANSEKAEAGATENKKVKRSFEARLLDNNGKVLRNPKNGSDGKVKFSTMDIPNGTYFLHIIDGKDVIKKQIIIQH